LLAFGLVIAIACFWSFVGFAIVSTLLSRRNLLQTALLAPAAGAGATVLLVMTLNWLAPVRIVGPIVTVLLLGLSIWLVRRKRTPVPFRRLAPFLAVLLLAALANGYPMFRFGFDWISYGNDDMANYCLAAKFFLNHNQFAPPSPQDIILNRDGSLFYWYSNVFIGMRHGVDEVLAWALSLTGLSAPQGFMLVIVAFELTLIAATGALVLQSKKYRRAALLVCLWLSLSALTTLGSVYQLFAQVGGIGGLAAAVTVLLRRPAARPRSELVLGGLLLASLCTFYPEVLPFAVLSYALYHALSILQRCERVRDVAGAIGPVVGWWLVFVNVSLPVTVLTLLRQFYLGTGAEATGRGLFPYYMTPAAFAYMWGFRAISEAYRVFLIDMSIVAGALLFGVAMAGAVWYTWKRQPVAIVCLLMMALSFALFHAGLEFGLYKIAMYLQPFLLGVTILTWSGLRRRVTRRFAGALLIAGLAGVIALGARAQLFYTVRSMGVGGGGLVEIPFASRDGLISQLERISAFRDVTLSDASDIVLAKLESTYRGRLFFLSQDFLGANLLRIAGLSTKMNRWNPVAIIFGDNREELRHARALNRIRTVFDMHQVHGDSNGKAAESDIYAPGPKGNAFLFPRSPSANDELPLIKGDPATSVLNRRAKGPSEYESIRLSSTRAAQNYLTFVNSEYGQPYHSDASGQSRGLVSMYQVEDDYFFHGDTMQSLGRVSLFRVLDPTRRVHLVLEYTASLNQDHQNRIPQASVIGATREMFPVVGRGSARLVSPVLELQQIQGSGYVSLEMGTWGRFFPEQRSFIMSLWGRQYRADNRRIVGFCRDISLISDDQYLAMQAPRAIQSFPGDLRKKSLEYSGIYEDGWVGESSDVVLQQDDGDSHLVVSVLVPVLEGRRVASWVALLVDDQEVERKPVASGAVAFDVRVAGQGRRRISLRLDHAVSLPSPDSRPVSAQIRYVGFQP